MSDKIYLSFPFDETLGNNAEEYFGVDERVSVVGAYYTNKDTLTAHGSHYMTFGVQNAAGTDTYYSWSTLNTAQGTITALTPAALAAGADAGDILEAGAGFKIHSTKTGDGLALDGSMVVILKKERKY